MDKHSQIARQQFQVLHERANKLFGKLRELQSRGDHSWPAAQSLFHKTFESFSRLWQFQLCNRPALLETGLQRSELGAIANKIGQLYYNYYLRSGDTGSLIESYTFYDAVHTRQYLVSANGPGSDPAAATRQMRFYARFVVVCLFLHRREEAMQLLQELQASVSSYVLQYSLPDAQEWQRVVNEVAALMAADQLAIPLPRSPGSLEVPYTPPLRCRSTDPAATCALHRPRLQEAILVSYRPRQVRVAELPLELFRMAQALEWQQPAPVGSTQQQPHTYPQRGVTVSGQEPGDHSFPTGSATIPQGVDSDGVQNGGGGASESGDGVVSSEAKVTEPSGADGGGGDGTTQAALVSASATFSPSQRLQPTGPSGMSAPSDMTAPTGRNPPRQLLHQPSAQRLLSALLAVTASVDQVAADNQFVLLYISADAAPEPLTVCTGRETGKLLASVLNGVAAAATASRPLLLCPPPHHHGPHGTSHKPPLQPVLSQHSLPRQTQPHQTQLQTLETTSQQRTTPSTPATGSAPSESPQKVGALETALLPPPPPSHHSGPSSSVGKACGGGTAAVPFAMSAASDGLLLPEELLSATRRRLLLVLDSDMGPDFARLQGRELGFPLLCIMAPPWQSLISGPSTGLGNGVSASGLGVGPASSTDPGRYGSLTAHALTCPAQALCALVGQTDPQPQALQELQTVLDDMFLQLGQQMAKQLAAATQGSSPQASSLAAAATTPEVACNVHSGNVTTDAASRVPASCCAASPMSTSSSLSSSSSSPPPYAAWATVFEDCLARRLLLHFAFYRACMHMHPRRNCDPAMAPSCFPGLPPAADVTNEILRQGVLRAAMVLGRPGVFICDK